MDWYKIGFIAAVAVITLPFIFRLCEGYWPWHDPLSDKNLRRAAQIIVETKEKEDASL